MIKYSIVLPTYNRSRLLRKSLEALAVQTATKEVYEIIIVNDGAKDNTKDIVNSFSKNNPDLVLEYIEQNNSGPAKARNVGIKRSRGEIIFFTDDDCVVPPNWIEKLADGYARYPKIAGAGGRYEWDNSSKIFAKYYEQKINKKYEKLNKDNEINNNTFLKNPAGNTSNMSYKKTVLEEVGGFDENINFPGFDDTDLKKRIMERYSILYIPISVTHIRPMGLFHIMKRLFNFGRGRRHFVNKHKDLYSFYNPSYKKMRQRIRHVSQNRTLFSIYTIFDFIFTRLGWEYQKLTEKNA